MAERIQRKRTKGWRAPAGVVNLTRPSDWGNPYRVGDTLWTLPALDSNREQGVEQQLTITAELAVALFAAHVHQRGWMNQMISELHGRDLMCYCPPHVPGESFHCHADWVLAVVNGDTDG